MPPLKEIQEVDSTAEVAMPSSPAAAPNPDPEPAAAAAAAAAAVEETKSTAGETFVELVAPGAKHCWIQHPRIAA